MSSNARVVRVTVLNVSDVPFPAQVLYITSILIESRQSTECLQRHVVMSVALTSVCKCLVVPVALKRI